MSRVLFDFIRSGQIDPIQDSIYGVGYRCSVYLRDGTYLPCVILRQAGALTQLAIKRFEDEKRGKGVFGVGGAAAYERIVRHFVATGNRISGHDVAAVEPSRFAIPQELLNQLEGETTMSWTGFVLEMADRKLFSFGTTFLTEFFHLPDGYEFGDVVRVHNHSYVSPSGELRSLEQGMAPFPADYDSSLILRERQYFVCHYDA